ncbi:hypothetical protein F511_13545 [Dorcoceras hygrometricum]|uniref:Splicing factor 3B subunit 1-like n=1 Tax=Dorcoceras hygrometricum TaxID=472368 RepID=A0A2Z7AS92_9LAMI|nr:hypothetical protein F511_13545 [Dorcoceras hygrometricum]
MAAYLIQNALQVNFDSVLTFLDEGMVNMFKALESTGLRGFLGCVSVLYEDDLVAFFAVGFVRENEIISSVQGKFVGISENQFAGAFELPTKGLTSMYEVPKYLIYDARSVFSASGEPVKTSCMNNELKVEFRLLNDILAKTVIVKDGSFDAITHERFLLMTAIHFDLKINWSKLLFDILKDMGTPDLTLGECKTFPPLKILTVKTVGTYVAKNKNITAEEDEPVEKVVKKAETKRRSAPAVVEPAAKNKRTTVGRAAPADKNLAIVPVVQNPEPISVVPAVSTRARRRKAPKRKLGTDLEEPVVMETAGTDPVETESRMDISAITNEEEPLVETKKENEKEKEKEATASGKKDDKVNDSEDPEPLSNQIPEEMMLPSVTAEELTKIKFGRGIQIKEVEWYKASCDARTHGNQELGQVAIGQSVVAGEYLSTVAKSAVGVFEISAVGMLSVVVLFSERFSRYFIEEQSADVVVSISRYRFEFQRVLLRIESTKSWADSDSNSSSSSSSSSESEQEEVHCFMADQTDEDEVFDFSNVEFTRDDLVIALNDMVKEYRKLSHSFEEAKAETRV